MSTTPTRRKHGRQAASRKQRPVRIVIVLILVIAVLGIIGELISRKIPTKEQADLEANFGAEEGYIPVIANHQWMESDALWAHGQAYLRYEVIRDELNGRFFWDSTEKLLLYTLPDQTVTATTENAFANAPVFLEDEEGVWVSLAYVQEYSNIRAEILEDSMQRLILQTQWGEQSAADVKKETAVRLKGGIKSPVITYAQKGDTVILLEKMDNWSKVQTPDGWIGYLTNDSLENERTIEETNDFKEPEYTNISLEEDICMVWHQIFGQTGEEQLKQFLTVNSGVNVIAPTWFSITGEDGSFSSHASANYVQDAHSADCQVWAVLENVNHPELSMTNLLNSTSARTRLIQGVMVELKQCGADGLNIDLEQIPQEAGDGYIQLIREFSVECRKEGIILSVDNMVPSAWTEHYNRKEQGIVADYVIIMGYDEHYNGSEPGSTASISFVQEAINNTIKVVPEEKVINGVPFYSRLWKEDLTSLSSEAIGMAGMQEFITSHNLEPHWMEEVGQNYVRLEEGENIYQLWVEDEASMRTRLEMMNQYDLAGAAFWKLGMQDNTIWSVIREFYNK